MLIRNSDVSRKFVDEVLSWKSKEVFIQPPPLSPGTDISMNPYILHDTCISVQSSGCTDSSTEGHPPVSRRTTVNDVCMQSTGVPRRLYRARCLPNARCAADCFTDVSLCLLTLL